MDKTLAEVKFFPNLTSSSFEVADYPLTDSIAASREEKLSKPHISRIGAPGTLGSQPEQMICA